MSARVLYDSFVTDPLDVSIQPAVFHSWLRGLTASELVADLPAQMHRHFQLSQSTTPQQRRNILRKRRHKRPSLSSSSSSSSPSSPSSLPPRVLSSPMTGSPNLSRRPSAADERVEAATPHTHTIIHQLAALHIPTAAAANLTTTTAGMADDSPHSNSPSSTSEDDSSDDELHTAAAALNSAAYSRLLTAAQHNVHSQYRVFAMLAHYFHSPHLLVSPSPPLQLPAATISALLSAYYSFHPPFVRELCGVKLKAVARGEVDVIGMRVGVRPVSAWRMLENVRRLYRVRWAERDEEREEEPTGGLGGVGSGNLSRNASIRWRHLRSAVGKMRVSGGKPGAADDADELDENGGGGGGMSTTALLSELFYLPLPLARSYTQFIFLCRHRIQADSKRLIGVGWEDMLLIAHWLMERWTVRMADEESAQRLHRHSSAPTLQKQSSASKSERGNDGSLTYITPLPSPALTPATFTHTHTIHLPPNASPSPYPSTAPNFPYGVFLSSLTPASTLSTGAAPLPVPPALTPTHSFTGASVLSGVDEAGDSLDMEFIGELRSVKVHIADNRRLMDEYITAVLSCIRDYHSAPAAHFISASISTSPSPPTSPTAASLSVTSASSRSTLYDKLKGRGVAVYVRALMGLAVPLGKPKRHRQLLLALVDDVVRLGVKGGLTVDEMAVLLECVSRGWEAVGEVRLKVNVLRERQREGLTAVGVSSGVAGVAVYNDEVARCYLNWMRFLSGVVPITALLYKRMRPLN